jgi:CHAP domain
MSGAHYRVRNMSRLHFAVFVFGLCLFGLGVGILSANAEVSRASVTSTTTAPPATTIASAVTEPPVTVTKKPIRVTSKAQIGTAMSIVRETTTTTSTESPKTPLAVAQSQVGKTGPYAEGGFYCAKFASWVAEQAEVPGFKPADGPSALYADAVADGRFTDKPAVGYMVFIDLFGPGGIGHGQVTHVGIVESIDGDAVNIIQGNGEPDPSVVTRTAYHLGDGYIVGFAPFTA